MYKKKILLTSSYCFEMFVTLRLQLIFITDADTKTRREHLNRWPEEWRFMKGHLFRQKGNQS